MEAQGNIADSELGDQTLNDHDVVISGMSSLMPGCENLQEWAEKLYKMENIVTPDSTHWKFTHPDLPTTMGLVPKIDRCDNQFFMINSKVTHSIDPNSRKLLEQAYQALFDAAICPAEISGKRIGVFIASSHPEQEKNIIQRMTQGLIGNNRAMFANRISYWLNLTGPSYVVDSACAGSTLVLQHALDAISNGHCEAAIVGASKLIKLPMTLLHSNRAVPQNLDGNTKCYDMNADGATISESVSVVYLQKYKDARRVYAQLRHVKCEYSEGLEEDFIHKFGYQRKPEKLTNFLRNFYKEADVSPSSVEYIEGFGSADSKVDKSELEVIGEVFCNGRTEPLLVGSVASNMGHTEVVSGLNGVIKILHGYHSGVLAANLHCDNPREDVPAIRDGRIQIVSKPRSFRRTYTAVNNFSLTGHTGHVLLKGCYKNKDLSKYKCDLPHLVIVSGRQATGVHKVLNSIKSSDIDHEELTLLRELYKLPPSNHLARGFGIFESVGGKTVTLSEQVNDFNETTRPLWFVYSGMGSQWAGMGTNLLRIPIFADAIQRVHKVLQPKGLDIYEIITSNDPKIFDSIMNAFVGIVSIQIGLTDVLKAVGLVPDKIIGHSVGELGCAYADECFTDEETILFAYSRGLVSQQVPFIKGTMAAVGMGYKEISKLCPPEVDVACHNGPESSTLSGPADVMKDFIKDLTTQGIFAREVNSGNIAYHSRYIAEAGPLFLKMGQSIVKKPKMRSRRWVSSSVPLEARNKMEFKLCSAEYHTNNLLSPVLFEESSRFIPNGAVLVEIAPHGLLQAILRRSLPSDCKNIPLTNRAHSDAAVCLLEALGKLFIEGCSLDTKILYPAVEYPVSTKTRQLSHLVEHHHENKWEMQCYSAPNIQFSSTYKPIVTLFDEEYNFVKGSVIEGKTVFPSAGVLVFVWDTLAMYLSKKKKNLSVEFTDIRFYGQSIVKDHTSLKFTITLLNKTGRFEVMEEDNRLIAEGFISADETGACEDFTQDSKTLELTKTDVYKLLFEKGYEYKDKMQTIYKTDISVTTADIEWNNNWTTFIDGIFQFLSLRTKHDGVSEISCVKRIVIDAKVQDEAIQDRFIRATYSDIHNSTRCGGVKIDNVIFKHKMNSTKTNVGLKALKYVSSNENNNQIGQWENEFYDLLKEYKTVAEAVSLQINKIGDFYSFNWVESIGNNNGLGISVSVHYAGLSVFDVKRAKGDIYTNDNRFGMDFSGLTKSKKPVMGIISNGAVCSHINVTQGLLWPVPKHWSLEDAATVPLPYCLAFYCLGIKSKLERGRTVLIHGGTGAVGQAAISIALAYNCTVFTTVSNVEKKRFLRKIFPEIPESHIGNSRDYTFKDMVQNLTKGDGCDIIISNVERSLKNATLHCCGMAGTTFDLVQIREHDHYQYGMSFMTKSRSYSPIDITAIFKEGNGQILKKLQQMVTDGIVRGYVRPLTRVVYAPENVSRAFQLLSGSRHRGRVLLDLRNQRLAVTPRFSCLPQASYLIVCDSDGFGLKLADKMVACGVKNLHIHLCSKLPHLLYKLQDWNKLGVQVKVTSDVLDSKNKVEALLYKLNTMGTVDGIFITNDDTSILLNLDEMSRKMCPDIRYFIVINGGPNTLGICQNRFINKYPVLAITIPYKKIHQVIEDIEEFSWNSAVDVILLTAFAKEPIIQVYLKKQKDIIENKLEMEINEGFDPSPDKVVTNRPLSCDKETGIEAYFKSICSDELLGNLDLLPMKTMIKNENLRADILEIEKAHMFIVPGLEGHHERFKPLCKRLKIAAAVLQFGYENRDETIQEIAQRFAKVIMHKLKYKGHFYLLGYEYGVPIVFEIASILESHGMIGTVFCLGGLPHEILTDFEAKLDGLSEWKLQNDVIQQFFSLATKNTRLDLTEQLKLQNMEDKVRLCSRMAQKHIPFNHHYLSDVILATYNRIGFLRRYKCNFSLQSDMIIIGASSCSTLDLQHKARYYDLKVPIQNIVENLQCPSIINSHLGADVLDDFNNRNLCESYLSNSEGSFIEYR